MEEMKAYKTSDGKKFSKKSKAQDHEDELKYNIEVVKMWKERWIDFCQACACHSCEGPRAGDNCAIAPNRCQDCGRYLKNWSTKKCDGVK